MNGKNKLKSIAATVAACALAASLTGCCMFGTNRETDRADGSTDTAKKHGANVSMSFGIGTDGIHAGSDANIGSHGASVNADADVGMDGVSVGAGAGVR